MVELGIVASTQVLGGELAILRNVVAVVLIRVLVLDLYLDSGVLLLARLDLPLVDFLLQVQETLVVELFHGNAVWNYLARSALGLQNIV